jgi:hypothetical protein
MPPRAHVGPPRSRWPRRTIRTGAARLGRAAPPPGTA